MRKTENLIRRFFKQVMLISIFMMSVTFVFGQVTTSGVNGVISGANGETLPGATVLALHTPSGSQYGTTT
jgi:hypothetical protein